MHDHTPHITSSPHLQPNFSQHEHCDSQLHRDHNIFEISAASLPLRCAVPFRRLYCTALTFHKQLCGPQHAVPLAVLPRYSTTTTNYATSADIAADAATYCTYFPVTTSLGVSFSTTTTLSNSTYHADSQSHHDALQQPLSLDNCPSSSTATTTHTPNPSLLITSTSSFLPGPTTASHTTHRPYKHYSTPITSSTTTGNNCPPSSHRPTVAYASGSLATLFGISTSHTTFTATFASTTTSINHQRLTACSTTTSATSTIRAPCTSPQSRHVRHRLPTTISFTIHCISPHQLLHLHNLLQTSQTAQLHQHHHHRPRTHLTAVAATTTKAGETTVVATATIADIDITATQNTTALPGDVARPQLPPTLTAPHHHAADPHNPSTYDPTPTTPTL